MVTEAYMLGVCSAGSTFKAGLQRSRGPHAQTKLVSKAVNRPQFVLLTI